MKVTTTTMRAQTHPPRFSALAINGLLAASICFVLTFSILAFGAAHTSAFLLTRLIVFGATILLGVSLFIRGGLPKPLHLNRSTRCAIALFVAYVVYVLTQAFLADGIVKPGNHVGSSDAHATFDGAIQLLCYLFFYFLCLGVANSRTRIRQILFLTGVFAFAITIFGIIQRLTSAKSIYWGLETGIGSSFFGPFIYENNFGAFIALSLPCMIAYAFYRFIIEKRAWHNSNERTKPPFIAKLLSSGTAFFIFMGAVGLFGVFVSESRAAAVIMIGVITLTLTALSIAKRNKVILVALLVLLMAFFGMAYTLGASHVFSRYDLMTLGMDSNLRFDLYSDSIEMIRDKPIFGWGLNSFYAAAPQYISLPQMEIGTYIHPNSDYLELMSECGIVGFALLATSLLFAFAPPLANLSRMSSTLLNITGIQSFVALASIALISIFDSHLRVPGIAYLFVLQVALLTQSVNPYLDRNDTKVEARTKHLIGVKFVRILVLISIAICLAMLLQTANFLKTISLIHSSKKNESPALGRLAADLNSNYPRAWDNLSKIHFSLSGSTSDAKKRSEHQRQAIDAKRQTASLLPTYAHNWFSLGQMEYKSGNRHEGIRLLEKATDLSPNNKKLSLFLISIYLTEHDRVFSPSKKRLYAEKATVLHDRLLTLQYPPEPFHYNEWMFDYSYDDLLALGIARPKQSEEDS